VRCMGHGIFVLNMFGLYNLSISARLVLLLDCYLISYRLISLISYLMNNGTFYFFQ